jgi:hypothetical protein
MSHLPYPPLLDELGLESALRWYIEASERSKIKVELELASDLGRLSTELETAIFRIMQECLTSIHRHSGSKTATIQIFKVGFQISAVVNSELQEFQRLKCPETVFALTTELDPAELLTQPGTQLPKGAGPAPVLSASARSTTRPPSTSI